MGLFFGFLLFIRQKSRVGKGAPGWLRGIAPKRLDLRVLSSTPHWAGSLLKKKKREKEKENPEK